MNSVLVREKPWPMWRRPFMYGYGNVSNHLSFVPSSGKSASKGFDTCERNHAAPIKGSSREAPGAARHAPGCAASRERGRPHLPPRLDLLLEVDQRIAPREGAAAHAGRLQRQRTPAERWSRSAEPESQRRDETSLPLLSRTAARCGVPRNRLRSRCAS